MQFMRSLTVEELKPDISDDGCPRCATTHLVKKAAETTSQNLYDKRLLRLQIELSLQIQLQAELQVQLVIGLNASIVKCKCK